MRAMLILVVGFRMSDGRISAAGLRLLYPCDGITENHAHDLEDPLGYIRSATAFDADSKPDQFDGLDFSYRAVAENRIDISPKAVSGRCCVACVRIPSRMRKR